MQTPASKPLVSIIIPIYKVEPFLKCCLDSVINQTYSHLEIILVDDGSPDNCPKICDEYAVRDSRIIVIHKENGGLSDARNAGLDICKGDFISFVDSDDWVDKEYIETLLNIAIQEQAELAIGRFREVHRDHPKNTIQPFKSFEIFNSSDLLFHLCKSDIKEMMAAWGKLYSRKCFDKIRFPKGQLYEDACTNYKIYDNIGKACYVKKYLYFYRIREDSIMGKTDSSIHCIDVIIERYKYLKKRNDTRVIEAALSTLCWDVLFSFSKLSNGEKVPYFSNQEESLAFYKKIVREYLTLGHMTPGKFLHAFFAKFPKSYLLYRKISPYKIRKT